MYITQNYHRYGPGYGFVDVPETGYTCPICRKDIVWRNELWGKDDKGRICHEKCLKEKQDGA